jgi:hypothetical protein
MPGTLERREPSMRLFRCQPPQAASSGPSEQLISNEAANGRTNAKPGGSSLESIEQRLLMFIEQEIAHSCGGSVTPYNDQFAVVGSVKVVLPGLSELHALGLIDVTRFPKRHVCANRDVDRRGW